jgi:nitroreductase
MTELDDAIRERRSTRMFLPDKPVPWELVQEALALAVCAPSSSNIQPWHVVFASGPARERLVAALLAEASNGPLKGPVLPKAFEHKHKEAGALIFESMGIAREDAEGRRIAVLRNWEFFRAPMAGIICMHQELGHVDAMGIGMFLQTFLLALTARGIGTCVQVSVAAYPDIIREQLGIADEYVILCGLAVGYPDPIFPANQLRVGRDAPEQKVVFLEE